jgi:hypothetical protein
MSGAFGDLQDVSLAGCAAVPKVKTERLGLLLLHISPHSIASGPSP